MDGGGEEDGWGSREAEKVDMVGGCKEGRARNKGEKKEWRKGEKVGLEERREEGGMGGRGRERVKEGRVDGSERGWN